MELLRVCELRGFLSWTESRSSLSTHLKVHVPVRAHKEALVLETPFEPNIHRLTSQLLDERLRIDRIDLENAGLRERVSTEGGGIGSEGHIRRTWWRSKIKWTRADFQSCRGLSDPEL